MLPLAVCVCEQNIYLTFFVVVMIIISEQRSSQIKKSPTRVKKGPNVTQLQRIHPICSL